MPASIKSKKKPVIQKGQGLIYDPGTFSKHCMENFIEVECAEQLLEQVVPYPFRDTKLIAFDTETHPHFKNSHDVPPHIVRRWVGTGKKATPQDFPFCMSVCDGTNSFALYDTVENNFEEFKKLAPLFEDASIEKIAHNIKFDMHMFHNIGMKIAGMLHDTVVVAKLANENRHSFALVDLSARNKSGITKFEYMLNSYKQMHGITDYRRFPKPLMTQYTCADTWNALVMFLTDYPKLETDSLLELYLQEMECTIPLYAMERRGMQTDPEYESPLKEELQQLCDEAESAIYKTAGKAFNINSNKQLYDVLLKLNVKEGWIPRTDKGNPSLDKKVLDKLASIHSVPVAQQILSFRKYERLLGTYANGIYDQRNSIGRVHGNINQTEATTGRMSITKPALQTLPKKDKRIRRLFIPAEGRNLWFMDLDQIEYRLFAHYAQAKGLIEAIKKGHDVHAATAAIIYRKDIKDVTEDERSRGKTINFSLIYGQGDEASAVALKLPISEARMVKEDYFAKIPEARPFINTVHAVIRQRGFVKNFYGRRRRLNSDEAYKAPNALIQSCAADYFKRGIVNTYKYVKHNKLKSSCLVPVHDEQVYEMLPSEEHTLPELRWILSDFTSFRVPITAGIERGAPSWGQKEEVEFDIGFREPVDKGYLQYNVFDGSVFDI